MVTVALALAGGLIAAARIAAACEDNLPKIGYLGITDLSCDCTTNFSARSVDGHAAVSRIWTFRSEPVVGGIKPAGPSAGKLREGDVITAVDGALITTREGSSRFSSMQPGQSIRLTVRREGREWTVPITVGAICPEELTGVFSLGELIAPRPPDGPEPPAPGIAPTPEARDQRRYVRVLTPRSPEGEAIPPVPPASLLPERSWRWMGQLMPPPRAANSPVFTPEALPRGWLGIGLSCQECGGDLNDKDNVPVWRFGTLPAISFVDPEGPSARAGLRRGDQLTHIDGVSLVTPEGGKRFGAVKPGQLVRWRVIRDGAPRTMTVTAVNRPTEDEGPQMDAFREQLRALREANRGLARSREMQDLMRQLGALERIAPEAQQQQRVPRRLRYAGSVGGSDVEVRGLGNVVVDDSGDEVIIVTRDATIRIRPGDKSVKPGTTREKDKQ